LETVPDTLKGLGALKVINANDDGDAIADWVGIDLTLPKLQGIKLKTGNDFSQLDGQLEITGGVPGRIPFYQIGYGFANTSLFTFDSAQTLSVPFIKLTESFTVTNEYAATVGFVLYAYQAEGGGIDVSAPLENRRLISVRTDPLTTYINSASQVAVKYNPEGAIATDGELGLDVRIAAAQPLINEPGLGLALNVDNLTIKNMEGVLVGGYQAMAPLRLMESELSLGYDMETLDTLEGGMLGARLGVGLIRGPGGITLELNGQEGILVVGNEISALTDMITISFNPEGALQANYKAGNGILIEGAIISLSPSTEEKIDQTQAQTEELQTQTEGIQAQTEEMQVQLETLTAQVESMEATLLAETAALQAEVAGAVSAVVAEGLAISAEGALIAGEVAEGQALISAEAAAAVGAVVAAAGVAALAGLFKKGNSYTTNNYYPITVVGSDGISSSGTIQGGNTPLYGFSITQGYRYNPNIYASLDTAPCTITPMLGSSLSTVSSTSPTTGMLTVAGGLGVLENIYAGGSIYSSDGILASQNWVLGRAYITSAALSPYSTTTQMNSAISSALTPYTNTTGMNSAISTALTPYLKIPDLIGSTGLTKSGNGTLSVNAVQSQITQVGTLTSLTVSGTSVHQGKTQLYNLTENWQSTTTPPVMGLQSGNVMYMSNTAPRQTGFSSGAVITNILGINPKLIYGTTTFGGVVYPQLYAGTYQVSGDHSGVYMGTFSGGWLQAGVTVCILRGGAIVWTSGAISNTGSMTTPGGYGNTRTFSTSVTVVDGDSIIPQWGRNADSGVTTYSGQVTINTFNITSPLLLNAWDMNSNSIKWYPDAKIINSVASSSSGLTLSASNVYWNTDLLATQPFVNNALVPYAKSTDVAATYATQTSLTNGLGTKQGTISIASGSQLSLSASNVLSIDLSAFLTAATASSTYATITALNNGLGTKQGTISIASGSQLSLSASNVLSIDLSAFLTAATASSTYATITALNNGLGTKQGTISIASGSQLALSASNVLSIDLSAFLTSASAASTYLTQTNAASTYLTQTSAASTYATQTSLATKQSTSPLLRLASSTTDYTLLGTNATDGSQNTRIVISGYQRASPNAGNLEYVTTASGTHIFWNQSTQLMSLDNVGNLKLMNPTGSSNMPNLYIGNSAGGAGNKVGVMLSPWSGRATPPVQLLAVDAGNGDAYFSLQVATGSPTVAPSEIFRATSTSLTVNSPSTSAAVPVQILAPSLATNSYVVQRLGISATNFNAAQIIFNYTAAGSTANTLGFCITGANQALLIDGNSNVNVTQKSTLGSSYATISTTSGQTNTASVGASTPYLNSTLNVVSPVNNSGTTTDTAYPIINMVKPGINGQSYDSAATFYLNRFSTSGANGNSELQLGLINTTITNNSDPNTITCKWRSDGSMIVSGTIYQQGNSPVATTAYVDSQIATRQSPLSFSSPLQISGNTVSLNQSLISTTYGALNIGSLPIPVGLTTEVGGNTPIINLESNFRFGNKNTTYLGCSFRLDTRGTTNLFNWFTRPAGSTTETMVATMSINGDFQINGTFQFGSLTNPTSNTVIKTLTGSGSYNSFAFRNDAGTDMAYWGIGNSAVGGQYQNNYYVQSANSIVLNAGGNWQSKHFELQSSGALVLSTRLDVPNLYLSGNPVASVSQGALTFNSPGVINLNPSGALVNCTKDFYAMNIYSNNNLVATQSWVQALTTWSQMNIASSTNASFVTPLTVSAPLTAGNNVQLQVGRASGGAGDFLQMGLNYTGAENISTLDEKSALEAVEAIRATTFNLKSAPEEPRYGWIAQEVGETLPNLVKAFSSDGEDGYLVLSQNEMVPILWSAVKELTAKVKKLESKD
ncbi:hypothetical protein HDV00_011706, partial [Rhizophlyctis rosea]